MGRRYGKSRFFVKKQRMGQYLCIGINTRIRVERSELKRCSAGEGHAKQLIEEKLANGEVYDLTETDDSLVYSLKKEIAEKEWCMLIKDFYDMRYRETKSRIDDEGALEAITGGATLEDWLALAGQREYQCYQTDTHWDYVDVGSFYPCRLTVENVILSMDGKIIMECYSDLFRFLINSIRKRLSQYKLAAALSIYLSD